MLLLVAFFLTMFAGCADAQEKVKLHCGACLEIYLADSAMASVIVCPGGSYCWLAYQEEGVEVARWLQANRINAFVLKYRVATVAAYIFAFRTWGLGHQYPDMLEDVEAALAFCYHNADRLNIDTSTLGVMGFSAGGHLTMISYIHNHTPYKPKFLCPIYPVVTMRPPYAHRRSRRGALGVWRQWNKTLRDSLSIELNINETCPPVFLVNCEDDPVVDYHNSLLLDSALNQHNIEHKYILYHTGGHGFGSSEKLGTPESREWKKEFLKWISSLNLLRR